MGALKVICDNVYKMYKEAYSEKVYKYMLNYTKERPLDINIETHNFCPLGCKFCCNRLNEREKNVMSIELYESIVSQYLEMGGGTISLCSMQSDLLSDPLLLKRLDIIEKNRNMLYTYMTTPLISAAKYSDDEFERIFGAFDFIDISVQGYNAESYRRMTGIDGFEVFCNQLRRIEYLKTNKKKPIVCLLFRTGDIQKLKESSFYREICKKHRIEEIRDSFFSWNGKIKTEDIPDNGKVNYKFNKDETIDCVVPNVTLSVQSDGTVTGCGCVDWMTKYPIGNVNEQPIQAIWKSEEAQKFRHIFSEREQLPSICVECGLYTPITVLGARKLHNYKSIEGMYYRI